MQIISIRFCLKTIIVCLLRVLQTIFLTSKQTNKIHFVYFIFAFSKNQELIYHFWHECTSIIIQVNLWISLLSLSVSLSEPSIGHNGSRVDLILEPSVVYTGKQKKPGRSASESLTHPAGHRCPYLVFTICSCL